MVIKEQKVITWLTNLSVETDYSTLGIPQQDDPVRHVFLSDSLYKLEQLRDSGVFQGQLPYFLCKTFEDAMEKSSQPFFDIDHRLFNEFSETNECGILILSKKSTLVYLFQDNTIYVWVFVSEIQFSQLIAFFEVESTKDEGRITRTYDKMFLYDCFNNCVDYDDQGFLMNTFTNKVFLFLALKKYAKVEVVEVPAGKKIKEQKDSFKNYSGQKVIVMNSRWFTKIIREDDIQVRGFFRFQNKKNKDGEWYKELIWVNPFVRHGYHRNAQIEDECCFG